VGTAGIVNREIKPGELVIALASIPMDGTSRMYLGGAPYAPTASFSVTRALVEASEGLGHMPHVGLIQTEDAFYGTTAADIPRLAKQGVLAVEMEASTLFLLGKLRKVETGCVLVTSNFIGDPQFVASEVLQASVTEMIQITLGALERLSEE